MRRALSVVAACGGVLAVTAGPAAAQAEVMAWGNVRGIRVEGERMEFESALCVVSPEGRETARSAKERQRPTFARQGSRRTVTTRVGPLAAAQVVEDTGPGTATLELRFTADTATTSAGHLCLDLPHSVYGAGTVELIQPSGRAPGRAPLASPRQGGRYLQGTARGVRIVSPRRRLEIRFDAPAEVTVRDRQEQGERMVRVDIPLLTGASEKGRTAQNRFTLAASGEIDRSALTVAVDRTRPGREFDGLGGNFRIQNPTNDPPVIRYNLANLRVAWGRVEMPWRLWHPDENVDPIAAAEAGQLNPRVQQSMEMARTLAQMDIPVVVSVWFPPAWAAEGELRTTPVNGQWGNALRRDRMEKIYASLADYLVYLKRHYGVEAVMFSFNESDLGIDVRQTAQAHAELIRGFGAYLASRGLSTRMLLADTSDANPTDFIRPAVEDPATHPYIGAVSFHSWRGWSDELLRFWGDAAKRLNVPLLVGEGSTDAGAWRYSSIFQEPTFAQEEIDLYVRILKLAEPKSILQWQLTSDYSLLVRETGAEGATLRPTQRFWNLKQLASTPEGAFALPVTCPSATVSCAAFGEIAKGEYAVHLVNNGAARPVVLTGLPPELRELRVWVTDSRRGMQEEARVPVAGGRAELTLGAAGFTTLIGSR